MESTGGPSPPGDEHAPDGGRVGRTTQRLKRQQSLLTQRIEDTRVRLERARPNSPIIDAGFRAFDRDVETGGVVLAGAVAFRIFLFLVPYVFVLVVGFGVAADAADRDPSDLARDSGIGGLVAKAVGGAADLSGFSRFTALAVGLFALYFGTRALLKVLRIVYGLIWGVRPAKLQRPGLALLGLFMLVTLSFAFTTALDALSDRSLPLHVLGVLVATLIPLTVALLANVMLPHQPTRWPDLLPGALFATVGVLILHLVTVFWIAHEIESKTDTYGAIGAALALLLWSYLLGRLITASAVVNATLWQRRQERAERRAARLRMHAASTDPQVRGGYTPAARSDSTTDTTAPREGSDGRTERRA
ncbi:MAG TPA: YhjD/YihY/BrkB family envelope integrity protein [Acidimicrobiia bacterium]|nr:YhjD/YihY/BrkB family envelope integrity protein [Acidimicrobiia bacterium]